MSAVLNIVVAFSPQPALVEEIPLALAAGNTVADALRQARQQAASIPAPEHLAAGDVGIWGRKTALSATVRQGDRVELYRPLLVDPQTARRERFRSQGARTTGLFARKRPGTKAGY